MRAQQLQLPIWVPPTPPTSLSPAARARAEWELNEARHELQRVYQMTASHMQAAANKNLVKEAPALSGHVNWSYVKGGKGQKPRVLWDVTGDEERKRKEPILIQSLAKIGLVDEGSTLDDVFFFTFDMKSNVHKTEIFR